MTTFKNEVLGIPDSSKCHHHEHGRIKINLVRRSSISDDNISSSSTSHRNREQQKRQHQPQQHKHHEKQEQVSKNNLMKLALLKLTGPSIRSEHQDDKKVSSGIFIDNISDSGFSTHATLTTEITTVPTRREKSISNHQRSSNLGHLVYQHPQREHASRRKGCSSNDYSPRSRTNSHTDDENGSNCDKKERLHERVISSRRRSVAGFLSEEAKEFSFVKKDERGYYQDGAMVELRRQHSSESQPVRRDHINSKREDRLYYANRSVHSSCTNSTAASSGDCV